VLTTQTEVYQNCVKSGTHKAGRLTTREPRLWKGVYQRFAVCATCGVPIPPHVKTTAQKRGGGDGSASVE
jgi:hypothetical protein